MFSFTDLDGKFDPQHDPLEDDPQLPETYYPATFDDEIEPNEPFEPEFSQPWRCMGCDSASARWISDRWRCNMCGVTEFYHASRPTRKQTAIGTWMCMPHGDEAPAPSPASSVRSRRRQRKRLQPGDPSDGSSNGREAAESETVTHDTIVEPSGSPVPSFGRTICNSCPCGATTFKSSASATCVTAAGKWRCLLNCPPEIGATACK